MNAQRTPTTDHAGLLRTLGAFDATCIVIGAIIGVGIFFTPQRVARIAGSETVALTAWLGGGVVALLGAITFAALGRMYPRTAGQYEALRDAFGPPWAFLFVFCNATAIQPGAIAIIATICAQHLYHATTGTDPPHATLLVLAVGLIAGLAAANVVGVRFGSGIQNATVVAKVAVLVTVAAVAAWYRPQHGPQLTATQAASAVGWLATLLAAMVPVIFSYGGWQHALWIGGEIREPQRNLPRAILFGVAVVVAVYLLANWAYFALLGYSGVVQAQALAADAVAVVWPQAGQRFVAAAVAVSAFGVLNAQLLSGPRLVHGMARDGRFFAAFGYTASRFHTPAGAIVLLAGLGLVLLLAAGEKAVDRLLTGVVLVDSVFFALTGAALVVLVRATKPQIRATKPRSDEATEGTGRRDEGAGRRGEGAGRRGEGRPNACSVGPLCPTRLRHPSSDIRHSRQPGATGPHAALESSPWGVPWAPLLFVLAELGLIAGAFGAPATRSAAWIGAAWIAAGLALYGVRFRHPSST